MKLLKEIYAKARYVFKLMMWPGVSVAWVAFLAFVHFKAEMLPAHVVHSISAAVYGAVDIAMMGFSHGFGRGNIFVMIVLIPVLGLWIHSSDKSVRIFFRDIKISMGYILKGKHAYK